MEQRIKLRPKQLEQITQIQLQKQKINTLLRDLNEREGLLVDLIIEESGNTTKVTNVRLEKDELVLTFAPGNLGKKKKERKPLAG